MAKNRYTFPTTLDGFINVYEDSGKFNNRTFSYTIPQDVLDTVEEDRVELIAWIKTKVQGRASEELTPWNDDRICKYTYGGETNKAEPVFVDTTGAPIDRAVLKDVRRGTKVRLIVDQKPWTFGTKYGTSMRVIGVQIVELATGNGAVDSGNLSVEDVAALFGTVEGYNQEAPTVRKEEATVGDGESYDF